MSTQQNIWVQAILHSIGDGILTIEQNGTIVSANSAAERIFGYHSNELIGRNVSMIASQPDREMHNSYLQNYLKTGNAKIIGREREVVGQRKDGTQVSIGLMVSEVFYEGKRRFIGVARDITERKKIETELARHRHHLEELIRERTQELEVSYEQLKVAEKLASIGELAAKIAHEIKNPLTGIYAAIQLLARDVPQGDKKKEIFENVSAEVRRLDDIVQDLLRYARPVPPNPIPTELQSFLRELMESFKHQPELAKHKISIQVPEGLIVPLDPKLMAQVFSNLILNASQAMNKPGKIEISAAKRDGFVEIQVADMGPGIPPEIISSIFDPFFTTKTRGSGLGLSICRKNVEAHGGKINVKSEIAKGSRFHISLPFK